jgi:hypothetical protein
MQEIMHLPVPLENVSQLVVWYIFDKRSLGRAETVDYHKIVIGVAQGVLG